MGIDAATSTIPSAPRSSRWASAIRAAGRAANCRRVPNARLFAALPNLRVTVHAGAYAHAGYLRHRRGVDMTETARGFRACLPAHFTLPHPSWRSAIWAGENPWFEAKALPALSDAVSEALG